MGACNVGTRTQEHMCTLLYLYMDLLKDCLEAFNLRYFTLRPLMSLTQEWFPIPFHNKATHPSWCLESKSLVPLALFHVAQHNRVSFQV